MTRLLLFLLIALLLFLPFNWISYRQLVRIHPRRKTWIRIALVAGNLMWPFFPMLRSFTGFGRVVRAVLGPLWFGWMSFTLLYSGLTFLLLLAWLPWRRIGFATFARWPSRVFLTIVIAGFFIGWYQAVVPLRVERVTVRIPNLPSSAEGTRVALMGDLHVGLFTRPSRLTKIFATAGSLEPDFAVIAGDLLDDDPHYVPKLLAGTRALPDTVPLYAVLGNHEMYGDPYGAIGRLHGSRIRLLVNEGVAHGDLWLAGISDPAAGEAGLGAADLKPDLAKALAARPATSLPIVVAHQPKAIDEARRHRVPLLLCAHTHGGQLGFRPLGWSLAGVFLRYHMGLYHLDPTQLYINTGTGYWLFPFRLGMTPEITLLELTRSR